MSEKKGVLEKAINNVESQIANIPHNQQKNKKEEVEEEKLIVEFQLDIDELNKTNKKLAKKVTKRDEQLEKQEKLLGEENELRLEMQKKAKEATKEANKERYEKEQIEKKLENMLRDYNNIKQELDAYKEEERIQKEQGNHVDSVRLEFNKYKENAERQIEALKNGHKTLLKKLRGEKMNRVGSDRKAKKEFKRAEIHLKKIHSKDKKINKLNTALTEHKDQIQYLQTRLEQVSNIDLSEYQISEILSHLMRTLSSSNLTEFKMLENLNALYQSLQEKRKTKKNTIDLEIGYITKGENEIPLFIPTSSSGQYMLTNPQELKFFNGDPCRVLTYKDGTAELRYVYKEMELEESEEITLEDKLKLRKAREIQDKKSNGINEIFLEAIKDHSILVLTGKNIGGYRRLLDRYAENIEITNAYQSGYKNAKRKIDKADIVIACTDSISHTITEYVKEHASDKTRLVYELNPLEMTAVIYEQSKQKLIYI